MLAIIYGSLLRVQYAAHVQQEHDLSRYVDHNLWCTFKLYLRRLVYLLAMLFQNGVARYSTMGLMPTKKPHCAASIPNCEKLNFQLIVKVS